MDSVFRPKPRKVMVKRDGKFVPETVLVGVTNSDVSEVLKGLKEGDEVQILSGGAGGSSSQTMKDRENFRARMGQAGMGGLRRPQGQ